MKFYKKREREREREKRQQKLTKEVKECIPNPQLIHGVRGYSMNFSFRRDPSADRLKRLSRRNFRPFLYEEMERFILSFSSRSRAGNAMKIWNSISSSLFSGFVRFVLRMKFLQVTSIVFFCVCVFYDIVHKILDLTRLYGYSNRYVYRNE